MILKSEFKSKFFKLIPKSWQKALANIDHDPNLNHLLDKLETKLNHDVVIYPAFKNWLAALDATPFEQVKVVIIGQDPYHGPNQAQGLSFSVPAGMAIPPSLRNIFKELHQDLQIAKPSSGDLSAWSRQGVLLLNAILTVEAGKPASHAKQGWEKFTDHIIIKLLERSNPLVLILWGNYAQQKLNNLNLKIDPKKHLVLTAAHPSPLSIKGFLGCKHFSKTNEFLKSHQLAPINWSLEK